MNLQDKISYYKNDIVSDIQKAVQIKSVMSTPLQNAPFGIGPAKALEYFLDLGKKLGFKTKNFDNYVGTIEFGEGKDTLGILAHVDVVPEGEGWYSPPYAANIIDGKIVGRGVLDNKAPAVICLYAMKILSDLGIKLNKKVILYLGTNEENESKCMDYYFNTLNMPKPDIAFTPDATFPVTYGEKGILGIKLIKNFSSLNDVEINGGIAFNCVPEKTEISIPKKFITENIDSILNEYNLNNKCTIDCIIKDNYYHFTSHGISGSAANPALGYNSICSFFNFLEKINLQNKELNSLKKFFNTYIKMELDGNSLKIACEDDESGSLSVNIGKILLKDNHLEILVDIRCPVKIPIQNILEKLKTTLSKEINIEVSRFFPSVYVPKDSFLVSTLMKIYQDFTGDLISKPSVIGGKTYSRAIPNCVAFGALLLDQEDNMHKPNESFEISKIDVLTNIFSEAIYQLAK